MKNERDYGIDLMRIVCALMVVVHHVSAASGLLAASHWNEFFRLVPDAFAVCAVNGFALISGYVGVGRRWKPANWAVLWADGVFYNFVLLALESRYQGNVIGKADIVRQFLPVTMTSFWYLTMYTGVFVLMPLMNHLLETMPRRRLAGTLLAMLALFSAWSSFAGKIGMFSLLGGFSTGWLAILYLVGGYIRRYDVAARVGAKKGAALYVGAAVFNLLLRFGHTYLAEHSALVHLWESTILQGTMDWMDWYISPSTFLEALGLLLLFANLHPSAQLLPYIKWAAPLVFGGYLFHDRFLQITPVLIELTGKIGALPGLQAMGAALVFALAIFVFSQMVDFLRAQLFRLFRVNTLAVQWEDAMRRIWNALLNRLETV